MAVNAKVQRMMDSLSKGKEPTGLDIDYEQTGYIGKLMQAFNWYNYEKDNKTAIAYIRHWVKKFQPENVKNLPADITVDNVFGWLARLDEQGARLSTEHKTRLQNKVTEIINSVRPQIKTPEPDDKPRRPSIQEAMLNKQREFLGEVEGQFDEYITSGFTSTFDLYSYMTANNLPQTFGMSVGALFKSRIAELDNINNDEQLAEGWSCYTATEIRKLRRWLQDCTDAGEKYANFKKANRKVRVKKAKPAHKQVERLQYLKESVEFKLSSTSPLDIVGAQQLWVFNTKNKKLGCYYASGSAGFSVKGTSLQGYDPDISVQRTLRKPEVVIPKVLEGGKLVLRKLLSELTTAETQLNGRINADTILLRTL